ncbi:MAG: PaaI family thioesterase [Henriciella sp.]|nr:PaaI family thioesterase [Henriciella sp.]
MNLSDLPDGFEVPEGFALSTSRGPFTQHNGPIFRASGEGDLRSGMLVLERHCNSMGFLHGGMASAFADGALAWAVYDATRRMSVTLKLTLQFFDTVRLHNWLEAAPRVVSSEGGITHVTADLSVNGKKLSARADATFRTVRRQQK